MPNLHKVYEFDVITIEDETGGYVVSIPALPGCHTQGDTIDEALKNIKEAAELYLSTMTDEERSDIHKQKFVGIQRVKALA
jgi:predicted RNase H-like HicB family nuclease